MSSGSNKKITTITNTETRRFTGDDVPTVYYSVTPDLLAELRQAEVDFSTDAAWKDTPESRGVRNTLGGILTRLGSNPAQISLRQLGTFRTVREKADEIARGAYLRTPPPRPSPAPQYAEPVPVQEATEDAQDEVQVAQAEPADAPRRQTVAVHLDHWLLNAKQVAERWRLGRTAVARVMRDAEQLGCPFPRPVGGTEYSPLWNSAEVRVWTAAHWDIIAHPLRLRVPPTAQQLLEEVETLRKRLALYEETEDSGQ